MNKLKIDLSDIGGPKAKVKRESVILHPMGDGRWKEVNLNTTTPEDFIDALCAITAGGITYGTGNTGILPREAQTTIERERLLEKFRAMTSFKIQIPELSKPPKGR